MPWPILKVIYEFMIHSIKYQLLTDIHGRPWIRKNQSVCLDSAEHIYNCQNKNTPYVLKLLELTYANSLKESYVYKIKFYETIKNGQRLEIVGGWGRIANIHVL